MYNEVMSSEKDSMDVSAFFKIFRGQRDWSQRELARQLDIEQSYISQLEAGMYKKLPLPLIKRIYNELLNAEEKRDLMDALHYEMKRFMNT